jgi:GT2 family glycosyltransferase
MNRDRMEKEAGSLERRASGGGFTPAASTRLSIALVIIGRNEGERLRRCLESLRGLGLPCVYVDSASTDGSPELALSFGAEVIRLEANRPFTAARARNAGWRKLRELHPDLDLVQFLDGDCKLHDGWITAARSFMETEPNVSVVFGHRQEVHPQDSIYNRVCHLEWKHPPGNALSCGGDACIRVAALQQVDGYDASLIAGEEPDLCFRLRERGWRVVCLPQPMSDHDVAIQRFSQWWKRSVRSGHAAAEGLRRHGLRDRQYVQQVRSFLVWGLCWPVLAGALSGWAGARWGWPAAAMVVVGALAAYLWLFLRTRQRRRRSGGDSPEEASLYALFCLIGKFPELQGGFLFVGNRLIGRHQPLIEYKSAPEQV